MREYSPGGISQYRIYSHSGQPTMTLATCICYFKCIHVMVPSNFETRSFYDSFNSMTWLMQSCFTQHFGTYGTYIQYSISEHKPQLNPMEGSLLTSM